MSYLVAYPEDRFSRDKVYIYVSHEELVTTVKTANRTKNLFQHY